MSWSYNCSQSLGFSFLVKRYFFMARLIKQDRVKSFWKHVSSSNSTNQVGRLTEIVSVFGLRCGIMIPHNVCMLSNNKNARLMSSGRAFFHSVTVFPGKSLESFSASGQDIFLFPVSTKLTVAGETFNILHMSFCRFMVSILCK